MTETGAEQPEGNISYKLRRDADGFWSRLQLHWQNRWFRLLSYAVGAFLLLWLLIWIFVIRTLPDAETLAEYQPPLPTVVRDINGQPFHSYARERRVQLDYADFPKSLIGAVLSAEDKTFFTHGGIDYPGILSAVFSNLTTTGRSRGASTITQQVAKNLLLTNEYSYTRKLKEAILAKRIESALTKRQILSLYLNEIALGRQAFGVEAAAQAYFGKSVDQLQLHEMAFLAILPKAPERYGRAGNEQAAIERRNWVLGEMQKNGWITTEQLAASSAQPLGLSTMQNSGFKDEGGYFVEEIRRQLIERFGETDKDGPYSVYSGGLWIRSSMHPEIQEYTTQALRNGLLRFGGRSYRGPIKNLPIDGGNWRAALSKSNIGINYKDWRVAITTGISGGNANIGFVNGETGVLIGRPAALKTGDVITVAPAGGKAYSLRIIPEIGGGMAVENPVNGRVLALQGGFDAQVQSFNRATQAQRQPGSTIKPFVYATALDYGMTPTTIIIDGPFCVWQSAALGRKCFQNFGGGGGSGPHTMRWGLEQSRNLMTVRAANDAGMKNVADTFRAMNIGDYPPYLAFALGAGDTTVLKMTNAYSMLVNQGKELKPTLIDYALNRKGKVILPVKWKACPGCNASDWKGQMMPRFTAAGKQVMDPVTAYQVVHMLEGVIQRGTATSLLELKRPLFGKTGTSTGPTNVWFVGGSPNMVAGVYLGYDKPRPMGGYAQGGTLAAPIFKEFARYAMANMPRTPFVAPNGVHMVRIDRTSGKRVFGGWPGEDPKAGVIWEAFKVDTEPKRTIRGEELAAKGEKIIKRSKTRNAVSSSGADGGSANRRSSSAGSSGGDAKPAQKETPAAPANNPGDQEFLQKEGGIY
jgi:penicillin-binding protein 1A